MTPFLSAALRAATYGYRVHPLQPGTKKAIVRDWPNEASANAGVIERWWRKYPRANVGIATGHGLMVIDEDRAKGGNVEALRLEPTLMVYTPSGGYHYFYRVAQGKPAPTTTHRLLPAVDTRGDGGYVTAAGSVVSGRQYTWLDYLAPLCPPEELPELPPRILNALAVPERPALPTARAGFAPTGCKWLDEAMRRTCNGCGDVTGFWLACQLILDANNGARVDVYAVLNQYAALATLDPSDPFDLRSVARWVRSAERSRIVARGEIARRVA